MARQKHELLLFFYDFVFWHRSAILMKTIKIIAHEIGWRRVRISFSDIPARKKATENNLPSRHSNPLWSGHCVASPNRRRSRQANKKGSKFVEIWRKKERRQKWWAISVERVIRMCYLKYTSSCESFCSVGSTQSFVSFLKLTAVHLGDRCRTCCVMDNKSAFTDGRLCKRLTPSWCPNNRLSSSF